MFEALMGTVPRDPGLVGQEIWTAPGTYDWVCPEGVESICCVIISAGQNAFRNTGGGYWQGGYGGGLRYKNNIPVVPGQTYQIIVGGPSNTVALCQSSAFGMFVGTYNAGTAFGNGVAGGWGGSQSNSANASNGGHAGKYTNGANNSGSGTGKCGDGTNLKGGVGSTGTTTVPGKAGGGGGFQTAPGASGGARIIWGTGRAYPSTLVQDM